MGSLAPSLLDHHKTRKSRQCTSKSHDSIPCLIFSSYTADYHSKLEHLQGDNRMIGLQQRQASLLKYGPDSVLHT